MLIKKQLVIVGGGFAGVALAKEILKKSPKEFEITLIDKNDYHSFYPAFSKMVASSAEISEIFSAVAIKFESIFQGQKIGIFKKEVIDVLTEQKSVMLKFSGGTRKKINYDYLVLSSGSENRARGTTFASFEDILNIKYQLENVFKTKAKRQDIRVVVVGGGPAGCSLVARLTRHAKKLADDYGHPWESIHLKLVESQNEILKSCSHWMRKKTTDYLKEIGVKILLNTFVNSQNEENADVLVWATGLQPGKLIEEMGDLSSSLRPKEHRNIFVVKAGTAREAIRQGKHIADVLKHAVARKRAPRYKPNKNFYILDFGGNNAFADLGFIKLSGRLAVWLRYLSFLQYFSGVISFSYACEWLKKYCRI